MTFAATWKSLTVGALMAGMSVVGVGAGIGQAAGAAAPSAGITGATEDCTGGGAHARRCTTNGSTALHTSPKTVVNPRVYGPYISPDMVWLVAD